jgi:asparagine synthase (glutamine-hydrolysing)
VSRALITGIARLDNRDEICRALGIGPKESEGLADLSLAHRAYERWGESSPERLLGDFAFVVLDERTGAAFGARDPLGVMPFYYRVNGGSLAFALSASGVAADDGFPLELEEARIADVLIPQLECVDATSTFYRGVRRLPPGHRLALRGEQLLVSRYWSAASAPTRRFTSDRECEEAFRAVFAEAVRCRLSGSTASMLSGGLDSSVIVGFARRSLREDGRRSLTTLSAVTDDPSCEESLHVRAVLSLTDLDPVLIRPTDVEGYRRTIDEFVGSLEEPFDDAMVIPLLLYRAARERGFDAVLDGVDGDVVASVEPDVLTTLLRRGAWGRATREAQGIAAFYKGSYEPWSSPSRLLMSNAVRAMTPAAVRRAARSLRHPRAVRQAVAESMIHPEFAVRIGLSDRLRAQPAIDHAEATDLRIGAALERYYRVAASQDIQPRHPFLDRRVVELCRSLPWSSRLRNGWSKWIVRRSAAGLVPDEVLWRRGRWVRLGPTFLAAVVGGSGELLRDELSVSSSVLAPYVDLPQARAAYDRYSQGDRSLAETVWKLAVLSSWLRKFAASRYDAAAHANGPAALPCLPVAG